MRVVCISDTHGLHETLQENVDIPEGDLLIHAGDFTDTGDLQEVVAFNNWLGTLPYRYKVVIAGNHESTFDQAFYAENWRRYGHSSPYDTSEVRALLTNALYLEDESVVIEGYKLYGSPWQPEFCGWAFNLPRGPALDSKWQQIPDDVDILVTHTPPMGLHDCVRYHSEDGKVNAGDQNLLVHVTNRIKPLLHVFGHVHEGYGSTFDGTTTFVNASSCTQHYHAINSPFVIDMKDAPKVKHEEASAIGYINMMHRWLRYCTTVTMSRAPIKMAKSTSSPNLNAILSAHQMTSNFGTKTASVREESQSLQRFRVNGTAAGLLFDSTLKVRPVGEFHVRALRYLFHQGYVDGSLSPDSLLVSSSITRAANSKHLGLHKSESKNKSAHTRAYNIRIENGHKELFPRRFTTGILRDADTKHANPTASYVGNIDPTAPTNDSSENTSKKSLHPKRKLLRNRQGVAHLATMIEEKCEKSVSPSFLNDKEEVHSTETEQPPQDINCVLCQYKVPGHSHLNSDIVTDVSEHDKVPCTPVDSLQGEWDSPPRQGFSKRVSSWF